MPDGGGGVGAAISAVGTLVGAAATGYSAFAGSKAKTPKIEVPALSKPAVMPVQGDEKTRAAKLAELQRLSHKSGRESTILTDETLG